MKTIFHPAQERGHADHGWLNAYHSFSFASYSDPKKVHFGLLRVLNDDTVAPGEGFGMHPHDNMEIVTIPMSGSLEHKDNTGGHGVIEKNEVQVMSAGTGIFHSEFNHSQTEEVKLFQIWVFPKLRNIEPRYDQKRFSPEDRINKWQCVAGGDLSKDSGALWINQDAYFSLSDISAGTNLEYHIKHKNNGAYIFLIEGNIEIGSQVLNRRDALGVMDIESIMISAKSNAQVLIIEVPMQ